MQKSIEKMRKTRKRFDVKKSRNKSGREAIKASRREKQRYLEIVGG